MLILRLDWIDFKSRLRGHMMAAILGCITPLDLIDKKIKDLKMDTVSFSIWS